MQNALRLFESHSRTGSASEAGVESRSRKRCGWFRGMAMPTDAEKALSCVLGSTRSSTYPQRVRLPIWHTVPSKDL